MSAKVVLTKTAQRIVKYAAYIVGVVALLLTLSLLLTGEWAYAALWASFAAIFLIQRPRPAWYLAITALYAGFGTASVISGELLWGLGQFCFAALWGWSWKMRVDMDHRLL